MYIKNFRRLLTINLIVMMGILIIWIFYNKGCDAWKVSNMAQKQNIWHDGYAVNIDIIDVVEAKLPRLEREGLVRDDFEKQQLIITDEDYKNLLCIIQAEAGGEDLEGKVLVGNVVMNRVKNEKFPDSITEVIFQRNETTVQFSPTKRDNFKEIAISEETIEAAKLVLEGTDYSQGALFFAARKYADKNSMNWFDTKLSYLFRHGGHEFYK